MSDPTGKGGKVLRIFSPHHTRCEGRLDVARVYEVGIGPDYFMVGDPHNNFYRGTVYYRDFTLEVPLSPSRLSLLQPPIR